MPLSHPGVLEQQPSDKENDGRFSNTLEQVSLSFLSEGNISFYTTSRAGHLT